VFLCEKSEKVVSLCKFDVLMKVGDIFTANSEKQAVG
jgi:hypothetical protein